MDKVKGRYQQFQNFQEYWIRCVWYKKIQKLVDKDYRTIVISNELAGFSEDIIKKYNKSKNVNIIIASSKFWKLKVNKNKEITYNLISVNTLNEEIIC